MFLSLTNFIISDMFSINDKTSKNKKNITVHNYKQWVALWEKAKNKCIPRKYAFKYSLPTFKHNKKDLINLI